MDHLIFKAILAGVILFAFIAGIIYLRKRFRRFSGTTQPGGPENDPEIVEKDGRTSVSKERKKDVHEEGVPGMSAWPSRLLIRTAVLTALVGALMVVSAIALHLFDEDLPIHLLEVLMTLIIATLIGFALSSSNRSFIENVLFFTILLLPCIALVVAKTSWSFWMAALVIYYIAFSELNKGVAFTASFVIVSQYIFVFTFFGSLLLTFITILLPTLAGVLNEQIHFSPLLKIRWVGTIGFSLAITIGLCIRTYQSFDFEAKDWISDLGGGKPWSWAISLVVRMLNLLLKILATVGMFFALFFQEVVTFVHDVFFSGQMWTAVRRASGTIVCLFVLAIGIVLVKPHLFALMERPTLLLYPSSSLLLANVVVAIAAVVAIISTVVLINLWLPRGSLADERKSAEGRLVNGAAMICICFYLANFVYYPFLNSFLGLGDQRLNWPGVYTVLAFLLAVGLAIARVWSQGASQTTE